MVFPRLGHCQTKFYTACLGAGTRSSFTVFAHESPPRSARFEAENCLYLFALTAPFDVTPSRLVAEGGYGSAEMIGWLVDERRIEPHVKLIDKAERTDGTFSRSDFAFDLPRHY
jgi:hypothetical protein